MRLIDHLNASTINHRTWNAHRLRIIHPLVLQVPLEGHTIPVAEHAYCTPLLPESAGTYTLELGLCSYFVQHTQAELIIPWAFHGEPPSVVCSLLWLLLQTKIGISECLKLGAVEHAYNLTSE